MCTRSIVPLRICCGFTDCVRLLQALSVSTEAPDTPARPAVAAPLSQALQLHLQLPRSTTDEARCELVRCVHQEAAVMGFHCRLFGCRGLTLAHIIASRSLVDLFERAFAKDSVFYLADATLQSPLHAVFACCAPAVDGSISEVLKSWEPCALSDCFLKQDAKVCSVCCFVVVFSIVSAFSLCVCVCVCLPPLEGNNPSVFGLSPRFRNHSRFAAHVAQRL
jgi:hypothetical protein